MEPTERTRRVMRGNRGRDTKPELDLRRRLHAAGLRYRVDMRPLPTVARRADIVFTRAKVAVFVDGCYWHGCPEHYKASKSNVAYWHAKITRNINRDRETDRMLSDAGWFVIRAWEHEAPSATADRVLDRLSQTRHQ